MAIKTFLTGLALPALAMAAPAPFPQQPKIAQIVGGEDAAPGEFPSLVAVVLDGERWCGGSLLNADTVVTAAHCTQSAASGYSIRAGTNTWGSGGTVSDVTSIVNHPDYESTSTGNDVSILKLATPIPESSTIKYVTLAAAGSDPSAGTDVVVAGWGSRGPGVPETDALQKVTVPIVSREDCNAQYSGVITEGMICAGFDEGGKDSCQGDSGGPLLDGSGALVGIVSWGEGCALPDRSGVYARVGNYVDFINSNA